ncbi:MAG: tyrosine-type recombinase/integrase, partial [Actinomycetota bacterium]|nr:tyrosine-type recombinase/integrase [Actinomycetota bacterium]
INDRESQIRRFVADAGEYPWRWSAQLVDEWLGDQRSVRHLSQSTIRGKSISVRLFCNYLVDAAYGWSDECWERFGTHPTQVCHAWNTAVHVQEAEGRAGLRAFTVEELQAFFNCADDLVGTARERGRKGWLTGFRDATVFKVAYAWGLRRREVQMLDVADFGVNPQAPEFGRLGVLHVRHGKAMKGSPPKQRSVLSVFGWAAECLEEWLAEVRPLLAGGAGPMVWPTERGNRVGESRINEHFTTVRRELGLPEVLTFHSLRRSYVTHLIEDGFDARFVQEQVGHEHASTTSIYTCVSSDFRTRLLRAALDRAVGPLGLDTGPRKDS